MLRIGPAVGRRCGAVALGLLIDRALGEPPAAVHPVAAFGKAMTRLESPLWADARHRGLAYTTIGVATGWLTGRLARSTAVVVAATVAAKELRRCATVIDRHLTDGDLAAARQALPSLVGRDPSTLDPSGVAAAVIESVAENAVDAVVAPAFWALVGGAPAGAAYRAINTMDAMVGHRSERYRHFGWASARLDDAANWVPARLYAGAVAAVRPGQARQLGRIVARDAAQHPSPNAGVAESAMAAVLGRSLGGPLRYGTRVENRPSLGDGPRPQLTDIGRALDVATDVENLLIGLLVVLWASSR